MWSIEGDDSSAVIEVTTDGELSLDIIPADRAFTTSDPKVAEDVRIKFGAAINLMQDRGLTQGRES